MAKKKLTAEEQAIADATAKIEAKYAKLAKERLNLLNMAFWPDKDVLGMEDDAFMNWLLPTMQKNNVDGYNQIMKAKQAKERRAMRAKKRRDEKKQSMGNNLLSDNDLLPH